MNTHASTPQARGPIAGSRWQLDPSASSAEFRVPHFWGLVTVKGHFERLDGRLEIDESGRREMTLTIDAASLRTGIAKRDRHLRAAAFFDTQNHPEVRFRSISVSDIGDDRIRVEGELEAAGRRLAMALEPTIHETGERHGYRRDHDGRSASARHDVEPARDDQVARDPHRPRQPAAPVVTTRASP